ncbi:hypothetical protein TNCV_4448331 [Trichonephila clavipes]|nr:hypothetical protein TNCV_4448331 [Trichonephila clavipes]
MYRAFAGTLNSRRAASPLVWWVKREEKWEASDHSQNVLLHIGVEPNQIVLFPADCLRLTTGIKILTL